MRDFSDFIPYVISFGARCTNFDIAWFIYTQRNPTKRCKHIFTPFPVVFFSYAFFLLSSYNLHFAYILSRAIIIVSRKRRRTVRRENPTHQLANQLVKLILGDIRPSRRTTLKALTVWKR